MDTNPVLNTFKRDTNRQIIIARLQYIQVNYELMKEMRWNGPIHFFMISCPQKLEGVDILRQDRRDAELDYVKLYADEYSGMEKTAFLAEHPLYDKLANSESTNYILVP